MLPKVMAFLALFWVFLSLISVWLLYVFSGNNSWIESKTLTQEELEELMKNYEALSWSIELSTWMVNPAEGNDQKDGTWAVSDLSWVVEGGNWFSE